MFWCVWPDEFEVQVAVWALFSREQVGWVLTESAAVGSADTADPICSARCDSFASLGCVNRPCNKGMDVAVGLVVVFCVEFNFEIEVMALGFELVDGDVGDEMQRLVFHRVLDCK